MWYNNNWPQNILLFGNLRTIKQIGQRWDNNNILSTWDNNKI